VSQHIVISLKNIGHVSVTIINPAKIVAEHNHIPSQLYDRHRASRQQQKYKDESCHLAEENVSNQHTRHITLPQTQEMGNVSTPSTADL
jgi:hypothetical protein